MPVSEANALPTQPNVNNGTGADYYLNRSKVFCMLPWTHMHIWPNGKAFSCCYSDSHSSLGNWGPQSLRELWNSEPMKALRKNMLNDQESKACNRCYEMEKVGKDSLRQWGNARFSNHWKSVEVTNSQGEVLNFKMPYMDIRFSNLCNFRCRTCCVDFSSSWRHDAKELGLIEPDFPKVLTPFKESEKLLSEIEPLLEGVEEIYFAGGEPLLMAEHLKLLHLLIKMRRFDVRIRYNTNFSNHLFEGEDIFKLWDRFENVVVGASIDGSGKRGELIRKGMVWSKIVENRKHMIATCPRASFHIAPTLSALNALHLTDLHSEMVAAELLSPEAMYINILTEPMFLSARVLPKEIKNLVREKYILYAKSLFETFGSRVQNLISDLESAEKYLENDLPEIYWQNFLHFMGKLDALRTENYKEVLPELAETRCRN